MNLINHLLSFTVVGGSLMRQHFYAFVHVAFITITTCLQYFYCFVSCFSENICSRKLKRIPFKWTRTSLLIITVFSASGALITSLTEILVVAEKGQIVTTDVRTQIIGDAFWIGPRVRGNYNGRWSVLIACVVSSQLWGGKFAGLCYINARPSNVIFESRNRD